LLKDNVEQFLSDLGGKIGYDIIRNKVGGYVMQSIAQVGLAMRQAITLGIPGRVFYSHKIFVYKVYMAMWTLLCDGHSDRPVSASQVDGVLIRFHLEMLDQQLRAFVNLFGAEKSPGAMKG